MDRVEIGVRCVVLRLGSELGQPHDRCKGDQWEHGRVSRRTPRRSPNSRLLGGSHQTRHTGPVRFQDTPPEKRRLGLLEDIVPIVQSSQSGDEHEFAQEHDKCRTWSERPHQLVHEKQSHPHGDDSHDRYRQHQQRRIEVIIICIVYVRPTFQHRD